MIVVRFLVDVTQLAVFTAESAIVNGVRCLRGHG